MRVEIVDFYKWRENQKQSRADVGTFTLDTLLKGGYCVIHIFMKIKYFQQFCYFQKMFDFL